MYKVDTYRDWLNQTAIGEQQANDIAKIIADYTDIIDGARPVIYFDDRILKTKDGHCHNRGARRGEIRLYKLGQNWGILAHELAHLAPDSIHHDRKWEEANYLLRDEFNEMARISTTLY